MPEEQGVTVSFDDLAAGEVVVADRYLSSGVQIQTGPSRGPSDFVRGTDFGGPCNGSRAIQTEPFVGPGILFRFPAGISSMTLRAGDFGPSDDDVITLTAYGDDELTQVVASQTQTLPNVGTGCIPLTVSASAIRAVVVGSVSTFGTLSFPNSVFVDDLSFAQGGPSFGADTSVHPEDLQFPTTTHHYDYYLGRIGTGLTRCAIRDLDPTSDLDSCTAFQLPAARLARSTFGYSYVRGPQDGIFGPATKRLRPDIAGQEQADLLIQQWNTFNAISIEHDPSTVPAGSPTTGPVVDGRTLFADIEPPFHQALQNAGWAVCSNSAVYATGSDCPLDASYPPNASKLGLNRQLLEGFLGRIRQQNFTPGVYTNAEFWIQAFGEDYRTAQPFSLWTSCAGSAQSVDQVRAEFPTIAETTLGGAKTVLWQYQTSPDYDITSGFSPQVASRSYQCTCASCPFGRRYGLYLAASPSRLETAGGTVTLTNPTDETIRIGMSSITIDSADFVATSTCTGQAIAAGGSCTITVIRAPGGRATAARLIITPPGSRPTQIVPIGDCGVGVVGCPTLP